MSKQSAFSGKLLVLLLFFITGKVHSQHQHHVSVPHNAISSDEIQPVMSGLTALTNALRITGSWLSSIDMKKLQNLMREIPDQRIIDSIQVILDKYSLLTVTINPEARVSVTDGLAKKVTTRNEWKAFLVKIVNQAGLTSQLNVSSENAQHPYHAPSMHPRVDSGDVISPVESQNRFLALEPVTQKPLQDHLSGARVEYQIIKMYFSKSGIREIAISVDAGKGTKDLAYRNTARLRFEIGKAVKIRLGIKDDRGQPCMASLTIKRLADDQNSFAGYYPLPLARVAAYDEYPDFFFQPQIYRKDGEEVNLAPGRYLVKYSNGPESLIQYDTVVVNPGADSLLLVLKIRYWIRLSDYHYFSSDHHVHAAGCSHYDSPEEGVDPKDMWRQQVGEDLNISANLAWGPSWYHQKTFFTGKDETFSTIKNIIHNDVEVSGFPSSHCGHVVLLGLKEDDYPGTSNIEQWPSWTAPVLQWAKSQGAIVGYAHSGWGLEPLRSTDSIFNYAVPRMDGIGANEFIATVTQDLVDFYSLGDTPSPWELTMLYHTWNCGFKTRISGETDFPCITDERVGQGRSYFKMSSGKLTYAGWLNAIRTGDLYVSDGSSHILDFRVNDSTSGTISLPSSVKEVNITARVAAHLAIEPDGAEKEQAALPAIMGTFWTLVKARVGTSRKVMVQCIMNGKCVDSAMIEADGTLKDISFSVPITKSAWFALRIFPSSHTNAIFVEVNSHSVLEKPSVEWCLQTLKRCWEQKSPAIRASERPAAEAFYNKAASCYTSLLKRGQ